MSLPVLHLAPSGSPHLVSATDDFAVIYKPSHLLIHPTRPDGQYTLLEWLRSHFPDRAVSLVNRLDRETSGLVLAALNTEAASVLGQMTMRREIDKDYLALVQGRPDPEQALIDAPIGRLGLSETNPVHIRQTVRLDGASAQTEYQLLSSSGGYSLLRVKTMTGRLHQIRVHLSHLGTPVVGDKIYGPDPALYLKFIAEGWTEELAKTLRLNRHALHAYSLAFTWKEQPVRFSYPLPDDMADFIIANMSSAESLLLS